jgi:chaperonin GroES
MATILVPLHDRLLVARAKAQTHSKGGIVIPDSAQDLPVEGDVLAVGAGKAVDGTVHPLTVKAGDRILFGRYAGTEVKVDGESRLFLREEDVLAIVATKGLTEAP